MKKLLLTVAMVAALLAAFTLISESSNKGAQHAAKALPSGHGDPLSADETTQDEPAGRPPAAGSAAAHAKGVSCKTCHECEYPTRENPCLVPCPKNVISVRHTPEQAPEVLVLDELSRKYDSVVFTHKVHAQMSEMNQGCSGCHHYNTTGPVLACKKCHGTQRKREEIGTPDLTAAYHRQCMPCHRKWSKSTDCESCHQLKSAHGQKREKEKVSKASGKNHPRSQEPTRLVYDTSSGTGRYVTFYHDEHVAKFHLPCTSCHRDEKCMKCHEAKGAAPAAKQATKGADPKVDFGTRHKRCASCHDTRRCNTCHGDKVAKRFDHAVNARWDLGRNHSALSCERCHGKQTPKKIDPRCTSCHGGWKLGSFNHAVTGLPLSKNHLEIDCASCHPGREFARKPVCKECHDDKEYPKALPGTRRKKGGSTAL